MWKTMKQLLQVWTFKIYNFQICHILNRELLNHKSIYILFYIYSIKKKVELIQFKGKKLKICAAGAWMSSPFMQYFSLLLVICEKEITNTHCQIDKEYQSREYQNVKKKKKWKQKKDENWGLIWIKMIDSNKLTILL